MGAYNGQRTRLEYEIPDVADHRPDIIEWICRLGPEVFEAQLRAFHEIGREARSRAMTHAD